MSRKAQQQRANRRALEQGCCRGLDRSGATEKLTSHMAEKLKLISLFSGTGGMDYGFEAAGFETSVALEMDHDCCVTLRENRPRWVVMERDIFPVNTRQILSQAGLKKGEADLLIGGPPCQPFS